MGNNDKKEGKELNLLLLGASGAGKSSFAKTFLLHSDQIDSTNDGQTTRSNIIYDLQLYEKEPLIEIKFLTQKDFVKRMNQLHYVKYLLTIAKILDNKMYNTSEAYLLDKIVNTQDLDIGEDEKNGIKDLFVGTDKNLKKNKERYGKICDVVEKIIENQIGNKKIDDFFNNNKKELNSTLSRAEGFFEIKEFEEFFQENFDDIFEENLDGKSSKDHSFKIFEYFNDYYTKVHSIIIKGLEAKNMVRENDYKWKISISEVERLPETVSYCLQVKEKKSLTGMIDYVYIKDSISNDYSFIMDDLNISTLKLFDTYGLDHANWDEDKKGVLSNVLYDFQEKRLLHFNSDLAVIYLKKLDSGKPTELKSIIPQIFNMIPQAPVYCVLNGIDIFGGSEIDYFNGFDSLNVLNKKPKSLEYLMSDTFISEIKPKIEVYNGDVHCEDNEANNFVDYLCKTLQNNIVIFCSDQSILDEKFNLLESNRKEIYKLLVSICMREYSSMQIIPEEVINSIRNGKYDGEIEKFIERLFQNSSKTDWGVEHWKTMLANYDRLIYKGRLGYSNTYQHKWNQLFHQGYVRAIKGDSNFLKIEDKKIAYAVDACIKNMEEEFLGEAYQLAYKSLRKEAEKTKFRELIEKMYDEGKGSEVYVDNPFDEKKIEKEKSEIEYLNNVCDFSKGYYIIKEDLKNHFIECLTTTIRKENKEKMENLLKINYDFYFQLEKLKYDFNKKYPGIKFENLLPCYGKDKT